MTGVLLAVGMSAAGAQQSTPPPVLRAGALPKDLKLDGRLTEPAWTAADSIGSLTQVTPIEGGVPASRTVLRVLVDRGAIVFGIVAYGPPNVPVTSFSKGRDTDLDEEDHIALVLDTFRDGRSGYVFAINPSGARFDGLISRQGEDVDESWDAIWEAATVRDGNSWSAEIRIPVRSLIFRPGLTAWGMNVQRQIKAIQEQSRWASPLQNIETAQTSRAGLLEGLPEFSVGMGLSVRPSGVAGGGHDEPGADLDGTAKASLDVTQRVGANILASTTFNTDFAETDVDTRRTNLTRFPLFFPEKRPFFLEGKDIFDFGPNLGTDVIPFFSRRIGLLDGESVPLRVGGKLNGRAGQTNFGALVTRTGSVDSLAPAATLSAFRVQQNVLSESSIGAILTAGDPRGRADAWTAGADAIYHTSRFRGDKNLTVGAWALRTGREGLTGQRSAYGFLVDYPNDVWDVSASVKRIGDGFDPSLGFVPRQNAVLYRLGVNYQPRPHRWGIRQMFFEQSYTLATNLDGRWESYQVFLAPVNWRLESGDRFEANVIPQGERLIDPFEVTDNVVIQPGAYHFTRYRLEVETSSHRALSGQLTWRFGGFYGGHLHQIEFEGAWKLSATLTFDAEGEHAIGRLPTGNFTTTVYAIRGRLNLSPDLTVSSLVQYDTESKSVGTNTRLRWSFDPAGDVFLVYNHNFHDLGNRWELESNQLIAKLQYTFRY